MSTEPPCFAGDIAELKALLVQHASDLRERVKRACAQVCHDKMERVDFNDSGFDEGFADGQEQCARELRDAIMAMTSFPDATFDRDA